MTGRQCKDIREEHADLSHHEQADLMFKFWPARGHDLGTFTSGINCLIVLLKRIYAAMLDPVWNKDDESVKRMEADNPFMEHAWLVLGPLTKDPGVALHKLIAQLWGQPWEDIARGDPRLQFKSLVSHARMQTTLWSMKEFTPMLEHIWSRKNSDRWYRLQSVATPAKVKDYLAKWDPTPTPDSVRLDAFPGMNLDTEVNKMFWRVLLKHVGEQKLNFDAFRRFTLNVGKFVDVDGTKRWQRTEGMPYTLAALVKHRNDAHDCDTIRVYDDLGNMSTPSAPPGGMPEYATPSWRMADMQNGDTFFALCVCVRMPPKSDPPFPEIFQKDELEEYYDLCQMVFAAVRGDLGRKRNRDAYNQK